MFLQDILIITIFNFTLTDYKTILFFSFFYPDPKGLYSLSPAPDAAGQALPLKGYNPIPGPSP